MPALVGDQLRAVMKVTAIYEPGLVCIDVPTRYGESSSRRIETENSRTPSTSSGGIKRITEIQFTYENH
jgi:hypothetical protein